MSVSWLEADTAKATRRLTVTLIWVFAVTVAYPYITSRARIRVLIAFLLIGQLSSVQA